MTFVICNVSTLTSTGPASGYDDVCIHVGRHIFSVIVHVHAMHHTSIAHAVSMNDIIAFIKLQVQVHLYAYVQ